MTIEFKEKFGLPTDRMKLVAGIYDFDIVKVEIVKSKKKYEKKEETETGTKLTKGLIDIAYMDVFYIENGKREKEVTKFYAPNNAIVESCKEILMAYGNKDGSLKEAVHIAEVKAKAGESKNEYLYFT